MNAARLFLVTLCILALSADVARPDTTAHPRNGQGFTPGHYPVFSNRFTGTPNPFHETVATLILKGARLQPAAVAQNLWAEGLGNSRVGGYRLPFYIGSNDSPVYTFRCVTFGKCNAHGMKVHLPVGAGPSEDSDHHIIAVDASLGGEIDGWGGDGNTENACGIQNDQVTCSWGGFFPFSGNGLDQNSGSSANNGGYAFGLFDITAAELLAGHIDHALGMVASCLDNPDIYPADTLKSTDKSCTGGSNNQQPQYGQLVHLKNSFDIASSNYSPSCKTYLAAFQNFGAYTYDTNNGYGLAFGIEDTSAYMEPNPWYTRIFPDMVRYGDGTGSAEGFRSKSCLNRLSADDIEIFDIKSGS